MTDNRRHWHLSRAIQIPVIIVLAGHIFTSIWWAATIDAKTTNAVSETEHKLANRDIKIENNSKNIEKVYAALDRIDSKLDKVIQRVK